MCIRFDLCPRGVALPGRPCPRGFTLMELLVVLLIILIVSAVALPTVFSSYSHRQVDEAGRLVQASLAGARDKAIRTGRPSGVRLLPDRAVSAFLADGRPDPRGVLAANRILPVDVPPDYQEGSIGVYRAAVYPPAIRTVNGQPGVPCLVLEQTVLDANGLPNPPTNWFWNIRIGERIQIGNSGPWYTIVGPMVQANAELFLNVGAPGTTPPRLSQGVPAEYLLLTNGRDDDSNGWIDEGWDGVDNDGDGLVDELDEWEPEQWLGAIGR